MRDEKANIAPVTPLPLEDLQPLCEIRAIQVEYRDAADAVVRSQNAILLASLRAAGVKRHQLVSGIIVQIVEQKPRQNVKPELLLAEGVSADIIKKCTVPSEVAPFIRVDYPDTGSQPLTGDRAFEADPPPPATSRPQ
jgi:hypothetical protein